MGCTSSESIVFVDWTIFERGNNYTNDMGSDVIKYFLDVVNNEWEFQDGDDDIGSVSSNCEPAATNSPDKQDAQ